MGTVRSIRLKEFDPDIDIKVAPVDNFFAKSDSTLTKGPFRIRTDSNGFIINGNQKRDLPQIAVIGDSFIESSFCDEKDRFISQAERRQERYNFINAGYSGSTTLQLYSSLISKVFPIIGFNSKVVFFIGQSDVNVFDKPGSYWTEAKLWSPIVPGEVPHSSIPSHEEGVRQVVTLVLDAARTLGIDLVLALSPFRQAEFDDEVMQKLFASNRAKFDYTMKMRRQVQVVAKKVAQENEIACIDFQEVTGGNPSWFYDDLHLNKHGQEQFSKVFLEEILRVY